MRQVLNHRLNRFRVRIPEGCRVCRDWPLVWIMNESGPEPPERCEDSGRWFRGPTPVALLGVNVAAL